MRLFLKFHRGQLLQIFKNHKTVFVFFGFASLLDLMIFILRVVKLKSSKSHGLCLHFYDALLQKEFPLVGQ